MKLGVSKKAFTLTELLIGMTISGLVMAGLLSAFLLFSRSTLRVSHYDTMETEATRALELLARDLRMAQAIATDAPPAAGSTRLIKRIQLTVPAATTNATNTVTYQFTNTNTLTRTEGGTTETLIRDIEANSAKFEAYNLTAALAANDYETNQIKLLLTVKPETKGNYAQVSKRVLSARFVLRNR
jgi:prepilin-type N-terminal cleavage/methylation domain-containing protein